MGFEKTVNLKIQEEFLDEGRDYQPRLEWFNGTLYADVDTGRFTARSKYGLEYRIEFADITKNLVDFWFVPSHLA